MTASKPQQSLDDSGANSGKLFDAKWSSRARIFASVLLIVHLLAVVVPPLAFQTIGPLGMSPAVETLLVLIEDYSQMLYLDRGYAFFAPDPGPSHLIQAGLTDGTGKLTEYTYPDLQQQWPRLLYHRHFMLAEYLNDIHQPPGPPDELIKQDPESAAIWSDARARYEHVRRSMTTHLERPYPGSTAAIRRIEHLIPDVIEFRDESISLSDQRLYQVLLDQPIALESNGNLVAPDRPPESVPTPDGSQEQQEQNEPASTQTQENQQPSEDEPQDDKSDDRTSNEVTEDTSVSETATDAPREAGSP